MNTMESCFILEVIVEVDIKSDTGSFFVFTVKAALQCMCVRIYLAYLSNEYEHCMYS